MGICFAEFDQDGFKIDCLDKSAFIKPQLHCTRSKQQVYQLLSVPRIFVHEHPTRVRNLFPNISAGNEPVIFA